MFAHKINVKLTGFKLNQINMQFCPPIKQNRPETLFRISGRFLFRINTHTMTSSHRMSSSNANHLPLKQQKLQSINQSIAILLRSYTRAINEQESRTGSLFRPHTKAECLTTPQGITPSFFNTVFGTRINVRIPEKEYPQACFNYIHQNPIQAKLAKLPEDWEFSSYPDYCGARAGKLINRKRAEELGIKYLLIR